MMDDNPLRPVPQMHWEFARKLPNAVQSEPISDEFFAGLSAPADKLVRETIQNSLDARTGAEPVRVRFTIPADPAPVGADSPWLAGLASHLRADRNGLSQPPGTSDLLATLLVEDYGTCGLTGNPAQTDNVAEEWSGQKNNFFYFWRAVGATGKGEGEKGSWGLGKAVLPASSRAHTFFGVSCEEHGGKARLLGLSVLRTHTIAGRKETLTPYGYFGIYDSPDGVAMPITDADTVDKFCSEFGVKRQGEPGLSLVILYPRFAFSGPALIASVATNYFFPILRGQLIVEVVTGKKSTIIDAASLDQSLQTIPADLLKEHGLEFATLTELLALARWSIENNRSATVSLNPPPEPARPRWDDTIFQVEAWAEAAARFAAGDFVEFTVPISVGPKTGAVETAEYSVSMKKISTDLKPKSFYLRDGITVGKPSDRGERGLVAFTAVDAGPLAKFLRLSEDPSHTEWRAKGTRLAEQYDKPQLLLSFIKNGVSTIYERLMRVREGVDANLLADLFFLDEETHDAAEKPQAGGRGTRAQQALVPNNLAAQPQPARVAGRGNNIVVAGVAGTAVIGQVLRVRFAYDVRRGNPFSRWSKLDFNFSESKHGFEWDGALRIMADGNEITFGVERADFQVVVTGFDPTRDVRVEAAVLPSH